MHSCQCSIAKTHMSHLLGHSVSHKIEQSKSPRQKSKNTLLIMCTSPTILDIHDLPHSSTVGGNQKPAPDCNTHGFQSSLSMATSTTTSTLPSVISRCPEQTSFFT
ncbi:hypothetical protein PAXRUDRAFT_803461, partial [Paxillus rubicundulus Ve08.2h10]